MFLYRDKMQKHEKYRDTFYWGIRWRGNSCHLNSRTSIRDSFFFKILSHGIDDIGTSRL